MSKIRDEWMSERSHPMKIYGDELSALDDAFTALSKIKGIKDVELRKKINSLRVNIRYLIEQLRLIMEFNYYKESIEEATNLVVKKNSSNPEIKKVIAALKGIKVGTIQMVISNNENILLIDIKDTGMFGKASRGVFNVGLEKQERDKSKKEIKKVSDMVLKALKSSKINFEDLWKEDDIEFNSVGGILADYYN